MIPYSCQNISEQDIQAVVDVLRSPYLTQGPVVPQFERAVADYVGTDYAVAVNSGTSALHLACLALGLGEGDWLWTSPNTFVASANCGLYCGAHVDFVDIDPQTWNMSTAALAKKLQQAEKQERLPKIVIPVHFAGLSCDMEGIARLAKQYGFYVIEDACHALGGRYQQDFIGCCRYSDITVFSYHPVKMITTAEGGIAVTQQAHLAEKMQRLRSHGITRDAGQMTTSPDGPWFYQQIDLGFNYRLTDMQAALGLSQLTRLAEFVARRHTVFQHYQSLLKDSPVIFQQQPEACYSSLHLLVVRLQSNRLSKTRQQVFEWLRQAEIGVNVHYIPVHLQPYFQKMGFQPGDFPEVEAYYQDAMTLPLFPALTEEQVHFVVDRLNEVLN